jgi:p-hydroxybenzoate 3-monooxygenase
MTHKIKTDISIIGGGPAGMLLSHLLDLSGITSVVIEQKPRSYVLNRIRAGTLESGTVDILRQAGLAERLDREAIVHDQVHYGFHNKGTLVLDLKGLTGRSLTAYGQTPLTEDLYAAHDAAERILFDDVTDVQPHGIAHNPLVTFTKDGQNYEIESKYIVGCDGFHGVSRQSIPYSARQECERTYPFGWLGVLSDVPPMPELYYAQHADGFMLASKRGLTRSRYYVQVSTTDRIEDWSDDRFWDAVYKRLPEEFHHRVTTGPSIEKSIAPMRSFVSEPMQYGNLFLAGDAAHIVPPTGAKGLNLAVSDVYYLHRAMDARFNHNSSDLIENYSKTALRRVWSSVNLSWKLTKLFHTFPGESEFDRKLRESDIDLLLNHEPMQRVMAYEKVGIRL